MTNARVVLLAIAALCQLHCSPPSTGDAGVVGGGSGGGSTAGGSTAGGSTAGGSTAGGSAGGSTAGGSTAGGSAPGICDPAQDAGFRFAPPPRDGGCGTPAELCFEASRSNCGTLSGFDHCGASVSVNCGTCPGTTTCGGDSTVPAAANHCGGTFCTLESDTAFCQRLGADCGDVSALDNCGRFRTVTCGSCADGTCGASNAPFVCAHVCAETNPQVCNRVGLGFGSVVTNDCCGLGRRITCDAGTPATRMAFTMPPLPSGPGIHCLSGNVPAYVGSMNWLRDPSLTIDGNVRVRLMGSQPITACLVSEVGPLLLNGCVTTCEADGGVLLCTNSTFPGSSIVITPTSVTADLSIMYAGSTTSNSVNILTCRGTAPYP